MTSGISSSLSLLRKSRNLDLTVLKPEGEEGEPRVLGSPSLIYSRSYPECLFSGVHSNYGEPKNFEKVLKDFPNLTLVLAHLGIA